MHDSILLRSNTRSLLLTAALGAFAVSTAAAQTLYVPNGSGGIGNVANGSGNVGIGTATPRGALEVAGRNIYLGTIPVAAGFAASGYPGIGYNFSAQPDGTWRYFVTDTAYMIGLGQANRLDLNVAPTGSAGDVISWRTAMSITNGGNIGIGTTSPSVPLDVMGAVIARDSIVVLNASAEGGRLRVQNPSKTGSSTSDWSIWNMTGEYGNGLSFWRYNADGNNGGAAVWFGDNGNVGIGTKSPGYKVEVSAGDTRNVYLDVSGSPRIGTTYGTGGSIELYNGATGAMTFSTSAASYPFVFSTGNVGIGTTAPTHRLSVNGAVRAKEVIVDTGWSDYVFADDYRLPPLSEVERQIRADKHLPGIPSAAEVAEHGVSVGEMQAKLLAKIEELTLHQIEEEKQIKSQREQIEVLLKRLAELEAAGSSR